MVADVSSKKCKGPCYKVKPYTEFAISNRINKDEEDPNLRHRVNICKSCQKAQVEARRRNELAPLIHSWRR